MDDITSTNQPPTPPMTAFTSLHISSSSALSSLQPLSGSSSSHHPHRGIGCVSDRVRILKVLFSYGADPNFVDPECTCTIMHTIAQEGSEEELGFCIQNGGRVDVGIEPVSDLDDSLPLDIRMTITTFGKLYPINYCAISGRTDTAKVLIDHGALDHASGFSLPFMCIRNGHAPLLGLLLSHGVKCGPDEAGSLMEVAIEAGSAECLGVVLDHVAQTASSSLSRGLGAVRPPDMEHVIKAILAGRSRVGVVRCLLDFQRAHTNKASDKDMVMPPIIPFPPVYKNVPLIVLADHKEMAETLLDHSEGVPIDMQVQGKHWTALLDAHPFLLEYLVEQHGLTQLEVMNLFSGPGTGQGSGNKKGSGQGAATPLSAMVSMGFRYRRSIMLMLERNARWTKECEAALCKLADLSDKVKSYLASEFSDDFVRAIRDKLVEVDHRREMDALKAQEELLGMTDDKKRRTSNKEKHTPTPTKEVS
eukprot:TRINITY_DN2736_c1_g1_i3.p1 TRINITY_DN2736_c1_g1~~TRINITY_DN2736_c1_g1_i3.p1  ORF type:complete len:544 (+),score=132.69 TRINITY_DN2736_c1_g1_i3:205-1632(+)